MAADGSAPISQTDAGATAARMPKCSTQSTTVVQRACLHSAAHWAPRGCGPWSLTSDRCRCRAMCPPSPGCSRESVSMCGALGPGWGARHRRDGDGGGQRGSGQREQEASGRCRSGRSVSVARRRPRRKAPRVGEGAECTPSLQHCLLHLSRGGGDAVVVREFDPAAKAFVKDGFQLAEAKSSISYLTEDAVLCGTDFGPGSMTASGYPRIVKLWKRGEPLTDARVIYQGRHDDVGAQGVVFHDPVATIELVQRDVSCFSAEYHAIAPDGTTRQLPLPLGADLKGAQGRSLIFTLREDWTPPAAARIAKGSLIAYRVPESAQSAGGDSVAVLYTPDAHSAIDEVAAGRDAVYASIYHDVTGSRSE